jgi:hypothetical protein
MPRLTNPQTGAVVNVSEEKAERLGGPWVSEDKPKRSGKKPDEK